MQCEGCKKTFSKQSNLKRHQEKCQAVLNVKNVILKVSIIEALSNMVR